MARPEDADVMYEMAKAMHAESPRYQNIPIDEEKARRLQELTTTDGSPVAGIVAVNDDEIIGMAIVALIEHWFSSEKMVSDVVVYVKPQHRRVSAAAPLLLKAIEQYAHVAGAREIHLGVSTGIHQESTVAFYKRMGYTIVSTGLVKSVEHV